MVIDKIRLYDFINKIKSFDKMTHNNKIQYYVMMYTPTIIGYFDINFHLYFHIQTMFFKFVYVFYS